MQQLSMAVANLQARADFQTEGRAVRHPVLATPLALVSRRRRWDAWVGLSHIEALVSPFPGNSGPSGNSIRPVLSKSGNTDAQQCMADGSLTLFKQNPH